MTNLIHKKGSFNEYLLPEKVYHGTCDTYLDSIVKHGLKINNEQKNSALSLPYIYLTTSIEMANDFAKSVSFKKGGKPIVLEIETQSLSADSIGFDYNISLLLCSQCITYQQSINVFNVITNLDQILLGKMLFNEPNELNTPVVWNLKEPRTIQHLQNIGYQNDSKNHMKQHESLQIVAKKNKL